MRHFFLIGLLMVACFINAASQEIDSLRKVLPTLRDTSRIECLFRLSDLYLCTGKKDSSVYFERTLYRESIHLHYLHGIGVSYLLRGGIARCYYEDYPSLGQMAAQAIRWLLLSPNKKGLPMAYNELSIAHWRQGQNDKALVDIQLAYNWARKIGDEGFINAALETMTDIYRERGQYDKLLATQLELVKRDRSFYGDREEYSFHYKWVMGLMYRLLEEYPTALFYWRKLFSGLNNPIFSYFWNQMEYAELLTLAGEPDSALCYYNSFDSARAGIKDLRYYLVSKGEYYLFLNQYTAALPYFRRGLFYHLMLNDISQAKRAVLDMAKAFASLHLNDSALHYAQQALLMALQTKAMPSIRDAYGILYTTYDRLHKNDSAYYYYRQYIASKEAVMNDQMKGKIAAQTYEHKIELLDKEQQQQIRQATLQKHYLLIGMVMFLLLGIIVVRNIDLKRKIESRHHKLVERELQLQKLRAERDKAALQQQAAELEMQALRAQMNPHFIFNSLNAINRFILQNNKAQASEYLSKFSRLIRMILHNSQASFITLENELEALELYLDLEALRFNHHFDYSIAVAPHLDTAVLKVPPLIVQPYAENAIWHGLMHKEEKGQLDIEVTMENKWLYFRIADTGIGRPMSAQLKSKSAIDHKSMGQEITAHRIALMRNTHENGSPVSINDLTHPDGSPAGTEVLIKIPIVYD